MEKNVEFVIRLNVPNISKLSTEIESSPYAIAGLSWSISVEAEQSEPTSNQKYLEVKIHCDTTSESPFWSCDANIEIRLLPLQGCSEFVKKFESEFSITSKDIYLAFIKLTDLISPQRHHVSNDFFTIEAKFIVSITQDVRGYSNFDTSEDNLTDITLVINESKLHVSKVYLSLYSPVFRAMFFSSFKEKEVQEIALDDDLEEFIELLRVIYPSRKPVNEKNVAYLLKLADKYEMKTVFNECEKFLIHENDFPIIHKLIIAEQYALLELRNRVVQKFRNTYEIKQLQTKEDYRLLSDATKSALFDKILQLV